jgi:hypothetical protein
MLANTVALQALISNNRSIHKKGKSEQMIKVQVMIVKTAIDNILSIIRDKVLPVLEHIAKEDTNIWKIAKQ